MRKTLRFALALSFAVASPALAGSAEEHETAWRASSQEDSTQAVQEETSTQVPAEGTDARASYNEKSSETATDQPQELATSPGFTDYGG